MARRFLGSETVKVDAKGRMTIPASFRRVIEASDPDWQPKQPATIIVVHGYESQKWLEVYTVEAFHEIEESIEQNLKPGLDERLWLDDLMNVQSFYAQIATDGRPVLPQKRREQIGMADEALIRSAGTYFTIWSPAVYEQSHDLTPRKIAAKYPAGFDPRSFLPAKKRE